MKTFNILTALALVAALAMLPACDNKPGDDIPRAVTTDDTPDVPAEVPAEEPMEEEAAEAPAEEPAEEPMEDSAEQPAEAPEAAEEAGETAAAGEPVSYVLEPNDASILGFTGYKVTGKQQGGWAEYQGTVKLADGTIESGEIDITINMKSLFSGSTMLTETLHNEDWFHTDEHPEANFTSTKIEKTDDGYNVSGKLTLRGATKNIGFPAQISIDGDKLMTQAEFAVDRNDWGISAEGFSGDLVEDEVVIQFDVVADKA